MNRFPLKDSDVILSAAAFKEGPGGEQVDITEQEQKRTDLQFTFFVAFGEGQIVDGEPVIPTLKQLIDFIERTINIFARHIFKSAW